MWQTYLVLIFSLVTAVSGQFLIKQGMNMLGPQEFSLRVIPLLIKTIFTNYYVFFGLVCYGLSFVGWIFVLSRMKLSVVYPTTSLTYVFAILGGYFLFKEAISPSQVVGIVLILSGLFFIFK